MIGFVRRVKDAIVRRWIVFRARTPVEFVFASESRHDFELQKRYNASVDPDEDKQKMCYTLLRENHVIEKGLSIKRSRQGFGQQKILALIQRLQKYQDRYGSIDKYFLCYPMETIRAYVEHMKSDAVNIHEIETAFGCLCKKVGFEPCGKCSAGVASVGRDAIREEAQGDFSSLLMSRHSIRYFDQGNLPSRHQIDAALELAQRTPSACNRQAWHTHVFQGEQSIKLAHWQEGCRGFEDEMSTTILVTADLKGFLWHEVHQAYVDGGLYAMNLINSIHFMGMGCIPLSTGFEWTKIKELAKFDIPENEIPILIVGLGNLLPEFKVAVSKRKKIEETNIYHSGNF